MPSLIQPFPLSLIPEATIILKTTSRDELICRNVPTKTTQADIFMGMFSTLEWYLECSTQDSWARTSIFSLCLSQSCPMRSELQINSGKPDVFLG